MDYKNKYNKYKTKYLKLKNNQIGGKASLVIHISGPSGSGKSTLGNKLKEIYGDKIIVKDIDDLRYEFIKSFYDESWTGNTFSDSSYQNFIDNFVESSDKPIVFVGLNHMPWWHKELFYNMHPNHKFYIKLDDNTVIKQKCSRFINNIHENQIDILNDLIDNEEKTIKNLTKSLEGECGDHDETKRLNNIWNTYYPSDGYLELSREEILDRVNRILSEHLDIMVGGGKNLIKSNDNIKLIPKKSTSKHFIKLDFPNIIVSQCEYREGPCGLTFIRSNRGFRVYKEIRGGWPGHIDCLSTNDKQIINGINIAGGSLLGLESTTGITAESLKSSKYKTWMGLNGAIIYSGNLGDNMIYPDKELGRFAFNQSDDKLYSGQVGAGLSASHGQGWGFKDFNGIKILALVVNNAVGVVYKDNKPIHNPFDAKKYFLDDIKIGKNTTIINVITNLDLDIDDLKQMNQQMNVSIGESIRPFNTLNDGDIFYTCSTMSLKKKLTIHEKIKLFDEFSKVLKDAILNSVLDKNVLGW